MVRSFRGSFISNIWTDQGWPRAHHSSSFSQKHLISLVSHPQVNWSGTRVMPGVANGKFWLGSSQGFLYLQWGIFWDPQDFWCKCRARWSFLIQIILHCGRYIRLTPRERSMALESYSLYRPWNSLHAFYGLLLLTCHQIHPFSGRFSKLPMQLWGTESFD